MQLKKQAYIYLIASASLTMVACHSSQSLPETPHEISTVIIQPTTQHMPPGQAKKIYVSKSAKPFAPGQRKKMNPIQYPIIIIYTPDIILRKASDEHMYFTNTDGITYFKGSDDRLYISDSFIQSALYTSVEPDAWHTEYIRYINQE